MTNGSLGTAIKEVFSTMDCYNTWVAFFKETTWEYGIPHKVWKAEKFDVGMDNPENWTEYLDSVAQEIVNIDPDAVFLNADRVEDFGKSWSPEALEWVIRRCYSQKREAHSLASYLDAAISYAEA